MIKEKQPIQLKKRETIKEKKEKENVREEKGKEKGKESKVEIRESEGEEERVVKKNGMVIYKMESFINKEP